MLAPTRPHRLVYLKLLNTPCTKKYADLRDNQNGISLL